MKSPIKYLFAVAVATICMPLGAQTKKADSLKAVIVSGPEDTSMVITLVRLAGEIKEQGKSIGYAKKAITLAEKLQWHKGAAIANSFIGHVYRRSSEYPMAIKYFSSSLNEWKLYESRIKGTKVETAESLFIQKQVQGVCAALGSAYMDTGDYNTAQQYYLQAIKISEKTGDKNASAENLVRIGIIQEENGEYEKSLVNYFKALEMFRELKNNARIALTLGNIGNVYYMKADYKSAKPYYLASLKLHEQENDIEGVNYALGYIAGLYFAEATIAESSHSGGVDSLLRRSFEFFEKALKISIESKNKKLTEVWLGSIGQVYLFKKDYDNALSYLRRAITLADELGTLNEKMQYEYTLSELYEQKGDYKTANTYYTHYITIKDSLFNSGKKDQLLKQELSYEYEKKEEAAKAEQAKKDAVTSAEKKEQRFILIIICSVLSMVVLFAVFIYRALALAKKQKTIIEKRVKETNEQREEIEQKNKDITDSIHYAKRIQQTLLPSAAYIDRSLKRLNRT